MFHNTLKKSDMEIPLELKYTKDHEWVRVDNGVAVVGITEFAQGELGDIVFIEIETGGETLEKDEVFGTIEAVKTVSDMFMPVSGEIAEVNSKLEDTPDIVNKDPYGEGWMIKINMSDPGQVDALLTADQYRELVES